MSDENKSIDDLDLNLDDMLGDMNDLTLSEEEQSLLNLDSDSNESGIRNVEIDDLNINDSSLKLDFSDIDLDNIEDSFMNTDDLDTEFDSSLSEEDEEDEELKRELDDLDFSGLNLTESNEGDFTGSSENGGINVEQYIERLMLYTLNTFVDKQDTLSSNKLSVNKEAEKVSSEYNKYYYFTLHILDEALHEIEDLARADISKGSYTHNIEDYVPKDFKKRVLKQIMDIGEFASGGNDMILFRASLNVQLNEKLKALADTMAYEDKEYSNTLKKFKAIIKSKQDYLDAVAELKEQDDLEFISEIKYQKISQIVEKDERYTKDIEGKWFTTCPNCGETVNCKDIFDLYITRPSAIYTSQLTNGVAESLTRNFSLVPQERLQQMLIELKTENKPLAGTVMVKPIKCHHCGSYLILPLPVIKDLERGLLSKYVSKDNKNVATILSVEPNPKLIEEIASEIPESDFKFTILDENENIVSEDDTMSENVYANLSKYIAQYKKGERALMHIQQINTREDVRKTLTYSLLASGTRTLDKRLNDLARSTTAELYDSAIFKTTEYYYKRMINSLALYLDYTKWLKFYEAITGDDKSIMLNGDYTLYDFDNFTREVLYKKRGDKRYKDFTCAIDDNNYDEGLIEGLRPYVYDCMENAKKVYEENKVNYIRNRDFILSHKNLLKFKYFKDHFEDRTDEVMKILGTSDEVVQYLNDLTETSCETFSTRVMQIYKKFSSLNALLRNIDIDPSELLLVPDKYTREIYSLGSNLAGFVNVLSRNGTDISIPVYRILYELITACDKDFNHLDALCVESEFATKCADITSINEMKLLVDETFLSKFFTNIDNLKVIRELVEDYLLVHNNLNNTVRRALKSLADSNSVLTVNSLVTINKVFYKDLQVFISSLETLCSCYDTFALNNYVQFNRDYNQVKELLSDVQFCSLCCIFGLSEQLQELAKYEPDTSVTMTTELTKLLQSVSFTPSEIDEYLNKTNVDTISLTNYTRKAYKSVESFLASGVLITNNTGNLVTKPFAKFFIERGDIRVALRLFVFLKNNIDTSTSNIRQDYLKEINLLSTYKHIYILYNIMNYTARDLLEVLRKVTGNNITNLVDNYIEYYTVIHDYFREHKNNLDATVDDKPLYPSILSDVYDNTVRIHDDTTEDSNNQNNSNVKMIAMLEEKTDILRGELGNDIVNDILNIV